jgi:putative nucleotidyltransferase with HDIG domain
MHDRLAMPRTAWPPRRIAVHFTETRPAATLHTLEMLQNLVESGREAQRTGAWDDALARYESALAMVPAEGDAKVRADLLRWTGTVHAERGSLDAAIDAFEASRSTAQAIGAAEEEAAADLCLANVELLRGNLNEAAALYLKARELSEAAGHDRLVAQIDQNLGTIANIQGNVAIALLSYRSALERYRKLGDDFTATRALNNMGMAHVDLAEWEAAESCFAEAAELATKTGDTMMAGKVELNTAELHIKRRRYVAAAESVERSLNVFHRLRAKPGIAEAYKFHGIVYRETGRPEQADTHFALSLGMAEACQDRLLQAETQMEWALLHLEEERKQEGILYLNRALALFQGLKASREVLDIERRLERLKEMYLPAVRGWGAQVTEEKDPYQLGHAQRVADYATKLAREVGVDGWDLTYLRIGAFIHDLGNIAVPAEVLTKSDALSNDERELMKVHAVMGDEMARQLVFPDEVRPIVRNHHEEWAGTGYPDRLAGDDIPLGARIVAIADVYDALTSPRSFRGAHSRQDALRIMERDAEKMFDPNLFGTFADLVRRL